MKVSSYIDERKSRFASHSFFGFLYDSSVSVERRISFLPRLSHFVMSFADISQYILPFESPENDLERAINVHSEEDANHWQWFINDLKRMEKSSGGLLTDHILFLWSGENKNGRLLTYKLISLIAGQPAKMRLVAVEVMEAAGNVFFEALADVTKEISPALEYCGELHLSHETGHTIGSDEELVDAVEYSPEEMKQVRAIIDDGFLAFENFFTELEENTRPR